MKVPGSAARVLIMHSAPQAAFCYVFLLLQFGDVNVSRQQQKPHVLKSLNLYL